jgi:hypothetical protein
VGSAEEADIANQYDDYVDPVLEWVGELASTMIECGRLKSWRGCRR